MPNTTSSTPAGPPDTAPIELADGTSIRVRAAIADRVVGVDADGDPLVPLGHPDKPIFLDNGAELLVPLTPCCHADGKGADSSTGVVCRHCYAEVAVKYATDSALAVATRRALQQSVSTVSLSSTLLTVTAEAVDAAFGVVLLGPAGRDGWPLRDRVYAALANTDLPTRRRVEVRFDPPGFPPQAAAVAVAALSALLAPVPRRLAGTAVLGDVGLDGSLRPVDDLPETVRWAHAHGIRQVLVPAAALDHPQVRDLLAAPLHTDLVMLGAHRLAEIAAWLRGDDEAVVRRSATTNLD